MVRRRRVSLLILLNSLVLGRSGVVYVEGKGRSCAKMAGLWVVFLAGAGGMGGCILQV